MVEVGTMSSVTTTNAQTGLDESRNDKYKIPRVHQRSLDGLRFDDGHKAAEHTVPIRDGMKLDFYAKLAPADELFISLHGAVIAKTGRYPKYWRVISMRNRVPAFMSIADPTLLLNDREDFCLAWYTGNPEWDPIDEIAIAIRQAMEHVGAKRVVFLGGSGGGHAALRLAAAFPESLAFIQEPQTAVERYSVYHQKLLAESCWPGWSHEEMLEQHPEKFDMCDLYRRTDPDCFVYYRQTTGDPHHLKKHLTPFQLAIADTDGAKEGRYRFIVEGGEVPGHGKITAAEFDAHFDDAMAFWHAGLAKRHQPAVAAEDQLPMVP